MKNIFPSILLLTGGSLAVVFNKFAAGVAMAWQRWLTGKEYDALPYRLGYVILGGVFVVMGLMGLLGYLDIQ